MTANYRTPTYMSWSAMMTRCHNPKSDRYRVYGARGITVCDRWHSFDAFLADMGVRPDGTSLDRIDGTKGYAPENCRWATPAVQHNNKRSNRVLSAWGETRTAVEWARAKGITYRTLLTRLRAGWEAERALTAPLRHAGRNGSTGPR